MNRILRVLLLSLTITFAASAVKVFAQNLDYYWTDNGGSDNWSDIGNWATRPAGSIDALQPAAAYPKKTTDNVFFDAQEYNALGGNINVIIDVADAASANFDASKATTSGAITRNFQLSGGSTERLTVAGSYTLSASPAATNAFEGVTEFTGTGSINTDVAFSGTLLFNNASGIWALASPLTVRNLSIQEGTLDVSANNYEINVGGNWTVANSPTAVFNSRAGIVAFNGSGSVQIIVPSNVRAFYNLTINKVNSNVNINSAAANPRINFRIGNDLNIVNGSLYDQGNQISNDGGAGGTTRAINMAAGTTLFIGDDDALGITTATTFPTGFTSNLNISSTVNYRDRTTPQPISTIPNYGNIAFSNAAGDLLTKNVTGLNPPTSNPLNIRGNVVIDNSIRLVDNGYQITGVSGRTFTMSGNSELVIGTATIATRFPLNYLDNNIDLSPQSLVEYNSGVAQTVKGIVGVGYGNLTISGASTKTLDANTIIQGNLRINANNTLDVSSDNRNITIQGDWISRLSTPAPNGSNLGTFTPRSGTVTFNGTTTQTITANTNISVAPNNFNNPSPSQNNFHNVIINNQAGIVLGSAVTVGRNTGTINNPPANNGSITFTDGIVTSTQANRLNINDNATAIGAKDASHVNGWVNKIGDDVFFYPIGNGSVYRPAGFGQYNNNSQDVAYSIRYVRRSNPEGDMLYRYTTINTTENPRLAGPVNKYEYWEVQQTSTNSAGRLVLTWRNPISDGGNNGGAPFNGRNNYIPNPPDDIVVAIWQNNQWNNRGGTAHTSQNANDRNTYAGSVRSTNATPSSGITVYTIGSINVALPIELLYFRAQLKGEVVDLSWATVQEINNDYFTVEQSTDGQIFAELLRVEGATNSNEIRQYTARDANPSSGISYYRLKQTDLDGKYSYSKVVAVKGDQGDNFLQAYQSSSGQLQVSYQLAAEQTGVLSVYDSKGRQVWTRSSSTSDQRQIPLGSASGLYLVTLQSSSGTLVKKVMMY